MEEQRCDKLARDTIVLCWQGRVLAELAASSVGGRSQSRTSR